MSESITNPPEIRQMKIDYAYFNGFELSSSLSDMGALLMIDGQPQLKVGMSFTTAKTLATHLTAAVEAFEKSTGNKLLIMDDVRKAYERAQDVPTS